MAFIVRTETPDADTIKAHLAKKPTVVLQKQSTAIDFVAKSRNPPPAKSLRRFLRRPKIKAKANRIKPAAPHLLLSKNISGGRAAAGSAPSKRPPAPPGDPPLSGHYSIHFAHCAGLPQSFTSTGRLQSPATIPVPGDCQNAPALTGYTLAMDARDDAARTACRQLAKAVSPIEISARRINQRPLAIVPL